MSGVLLDTMVLGSFHRSRVPEKWRRVWKDVREGRRSVVLAEELLAELYHQDSRVWGEEATRHWILWLKGLPRAIVRPADDRLAFLAGHLHVRFHGRHGLSLADCFALAFARQERVELLTTEVGLRRAAEELGVRANWLPVSSLA